MLTREARARCGHGETTSIRPDQPHSYGSRQWCSACGVFFADPACPGCAEIGTHEEGCGPQPDIDWPATEAADREQMEREGQGRLPL